MRSSSISTRRRFLKISRIQSVVCGRLSCRPIFITRTFARSTLPYFVPLAYLFIPSCEWEIVSRSPDLTVLITNSVLIASRSCVIVTDVLVLVITWWRTYGTRKAAAEANIKVSLSTLILRDGEPLLQDMLSTVV